MIKEVTTSMMRSFKDCRKKYWFEYVLELKPLETPKALHWGTLYHKGVEEILKGTQPDAVEVMLLNEQATECLKKNVDFDEQTVRVVMCAVRAFSTESGWENWDITSVEKQFEVTTGYAKRLKGKIDGIIKHDGKSFLIEHKTTSQYGEDYLHGLLWDEQSTNYLYAHNRMLEDGVITGNEVVGIFYIITEKPTIKPYSATPAEARKYKKDGTPYANQHETDEPIADYVARVQLWYASEPRIHLHFVYRTPQEIKERVQDMNLTIKDMVAAEREDTFYRNPSACKIFPCPYRCKCLDNEPDTDVLFIKKTQKNEELI